MKLRFPLLYFHSGLGMTSWSLETSLAPVTVHRQPAKSPSWALESFASSLMFPLTTKFSWSIRIRRSEEHTSELQSHSDLVCRLLLEKKKIEKLPQNRRLQT